MNAVSSFLSSFTDMGMKRLYKFVIKRVLKDIVDGDIDLSMLDVSILGGSLELKNISLNSSFLNESLAELLPLGTFVIESGVVNYLHVLISYKDILNESISITVRGVTVNVTAKGNLNKGKPKMQESKETPPTPISATSTAEHEDGVYNVKEGLDALANWIEIITQKIKFSLMNLTIKINGHSLDKDSKRPYLEILLESLNYYDETPMINNQNISETKKDLSSSVVSLQGISLHKTVMFKGISLNIIKYDDDGVESKTLMGNFSTSRDNFIKIKLDSDLPTSDSPPVSIDMFMHPITFQLRPFQLDTLVSIFETYRNSVKDSTKAAQVSSTIGSTSERVPRGTWMDINEGENEKGTLTKLEFQRLDAILTKFAISNKSLFSDTRSVSLNKSNLGNSYNSLSSTEYFDSIDDTFIETSKMSKSIGIFQTELNVKLHLLEINSCLFYFDVFEETMTHSDHLSINLNDCIIQIKLSSNKSFSIDATLNGFNVNESLMNCGSSIPSKTSILKVKNLPSTFAISLKINYLINSNPPLASNYKPKELLFNISSNPIIFIWDNDCIHRWKPFIELISDRPAFKNKRNVEDEPVFISFSDKILNDVNKLKKVRKFDKDEEDGLFLSCSINCSNISFKMMIHNTMKDMKEERILKDFFGIQLATVQITSKSNSGTNVVSKEDNVRTGLCDWNIEFTSCSISLEGVGDPLIIAKIQHIQSSSTIGSSEPKVMIRLGAGNLSSGILDSKSTSIPKFNRFFESKTSNKEPIIEENEEEATLKVDSEDKNMERIMFQTKAIESSIVSIFVTFPRVEIELTKISFDRLIDLLQIMSIYAPPGASRPLVAMSQSHYKSAMSILLNIKSLHLVLNDAISEKHVVQSHTPNPANFSGSDNMYIFDAQDISLFQVACLFGKKENRLHVAIADVSVFEMPLLNTKSGERAKGVSIPLIYRCKWASNLQVGLENVCDMISLTTVISNDNESFTEIKSIIDISSILLRYTTNLDKWTKNLQLFTDFAKMSHKTLDEIVWRKINLNSDESLRGKTIMNKLYISLYDTSLDYAPCLLPIHTNTMSSPQIIINIGFVKFSSSIVSSGRQLGFKIEIRDITIHLANQSKLDEDEKTVCGWMQNNLISGGSHTWTDSELYLSGNGFVHVLRIDSIDLFIKNYLNEITLLNERTEVELSGGEITLFSCFDSLSLLMDILSNWADAVFPKKAQRPAVILSSDAKTTLLAKEIKVFEGIKSDAFLVVPSTPVTLNHKQSNQANQLSNQAARKDIPDDQLSGTELRERKNNIGFMNVEAMVIEDYYPAAGLSLNKEKKISIKSKENPDSKWLSNIDTEDEYVENEWINFVVESGLLRDDKKTLQFVNEAENTVKTESVDEKINKSSDSLEISEDSMEAAEKMLFGDIKDDSEEEIEIANSPKAKIVFNTSHSAFVVPVLSSDDEGDEEDGNELLKSMHESSVNASSKFWFPSARVENFIVEEELSDLAANMKIKSTLPEEKDLKSEIGNGSNFDLDYALNSLDNEEDLNSDGGNSNELQIFTNNLNNLSKSMLWKSNHSSQTSEDASLKATNRDEEKDQDVEVTFDNNELAKSCLLGLLSESSEKQNNDNTNIDIDLNFKPLCLEEVNFPQNGIGRTTKIDEMPNHMTASFLSFGLRGENSRYYDGPNSVKFYPYHIPIPSDNSERSFRQQFFSKDDEDQSQGRVEFRLLVIDINIKCKLFGGNDFSPFNAQHLKITQKQVTSAPISNPVNLLDALLENYAVPTSVEKEKKKPLFHDKKEKSKNFIPEAPNGQSEKINQRNLLNFRDTTSMVEFNLFNISASIETFVNDDIKENDRFPFTNKIILRARNIELLDQIKSSDVKRVLSHWKDDEFHPRELNSSMLLLTFDVVSIPKQRAAFVGEEEYRLTLSLLPLRIVLGQSLIDFFISFSKNLGNLQEKQSEIDSISDIQHLSPFFSFVDIKSIKIKFDYATKMVNINNLKRGEIIELLNICPIEGMQIKLERVTLHGLRGITPIVESISASYIEDITSKQLHNVIASLGAIRPLANVSSGVVDLLLLPINQYKKDGRVVHGLKKGASKLLKVMTIETLGIASTVSRVVRDVMSIADPSIQYKTKDPSSAEEGISQAYHSLSKGVHGAYNSLTKGVKGESQTVIAIPVEHTYRDSATGLIKSVVRAVPIAVLQPIIGVSDAVNSLSLGIRNSLDKDLFEEDYSRYKNLSDR